MQKRFLTIIASALVPLVLAACSPAGICPACRGGCPTLYPVELVFPASGSTGVPTDIGAIVIQGGFKLNDGAGVSVEAPSGTVVTEPVMPPPSPLPSPLATPSDVAGDPFASASIPPLLAHTTYTVNFIQQIGIDTGCVAIGKTLGSFTTP